MRERKKLEEKLEPPYSLGIFLTPLAKGCIFSSKLFTAGMETREIEVEPSFQDLVESMQNHFGQDRKNQLGLSFDANVSYEKDSRLSYLQPSKRNSPLELITNHRNGFSKSMGDLSLLDSNVYLRRSVMFEEDLTAHTAMLERARSRFRKLELKYPEIFKNSTKTTSISYLTSNSRTASVDRLGIGLRTNSRCSMDAQEVKETDKLGDLSEASDHRQLILKCGSFGQRIIKPPPLSSAMRSHNMEDSCDSAFDEVDRESVHSRTSHDRSPPINCSKEASSSRFLYPGDSLESDKDSGISTDRPFIPTTRPPKYPRPVTWAEPELGLNVSKTKSKSLSTLSVDGDCAFKRYGVDSVNDLSDIRFRTSRVSADRRGILKSAAYKNQGIRGGSVDIPTPSHSEHQLPPANNPRCENPNQKSGSDVYRRMCSYLPSSVSQDDGDSDAETIYSVQSEIIVRPRMTARQQYVSTYSLNRTSEDSIHENRVYKSRSLPNIDISSSLFDHPPGFGGELIGDNQKKRRKRILQRFGHRSGLYVVNDIPASDKPRLPVSQRSKKSKKTKSKKSTHDVTHVTESTKVWFDHTTAVSRPTGGQSLGRVVTMREDIGMAYEIELQKPVNGLFGFFIQKGYKHFQKGIFISRIMDSSCAKFLAGLLNPGDELLEINGESTKTKAISEVHNIMANSDRLLLTILPFVGRKDW